MWRGRPTRARIVVYVAGFTFAVLLDPLTPLGVADWLIELILVGIACVWGGRREMYMVAAIGSATMILGLWSSPPSVLPIWIGTLNRLVAVIAIWTTVHVASQRRLSEAARQKAAAQIKILQGLLPICCSCKAIRTASGDWERLETFLLDHSEARLSHTYCPECAEKFLAEADDTLTSANTLGESR